MLNKHAITGATPATIFLGRQLRTSFRILSSTAYSKLPLRKEFQKGVIVHQSGKIITLDERNRLVRRHSDQIKVVPDTHNVSERIGQNERTENILSDQTTRKPPESIHQENSETEHNLVDHSPRHHVASPSPTPFVALS